MKKFRRPCESCGEPMHKIGPFAPTKLEGQPAAKFNGIYEYECINDRCDQHKEIIEVTVEDDATLEEKMYQTCECGHSRTMHGYRLSRAPENGPMQTRQVDARCSVTDCPCEEYISRE